MKLAWTLVIAAVVCHVQARRIIGGEPTTIEQYPSIVQVESYYAEYNVWSQSCAATIINNKYVVSAAHCFWGLSFNINNRRIRAGSSNRNFGGIIVNAVRRLNHPSYSPLLILSRGNDGDIALVELATTLTYSAGIQNVPIPPQGYELPDDLPVVHAGWGDTVQGANAGSPILRDVTIYTINRELCSQRYSELPLPRPVTQNMICAGILDEGGKDACQGDSGGPLYYGNILVGVVSWGHGCANETYPGLSARVSSYTTWLLDNAV